MGFNENIFLCRILIFLFLNMLSLTSGTHQTNLYISFLWKHMFVGPDPKVAYVSTFQSISFLEEKAGEQRWDLLLIIVYFLGNMASYKLEIRISVFLNYVICYLGEK